MIKEEIIVELELDFYMLMYKKVNKILGTEYRSDFDIHWTNVSSKYALSEDFMREFHSYIKWDTISANQILSSQFMIDFIDKLSLTDIAMYQSLDLDFIKKINETYRMDCDNFNVLAASHQILKKETLDYFASEIYKDSNSIFWKTVSIAQPFIDIPGDPTSDKSFGDKIDPESLKGNIYYRNRNHSKVYLTGYINENKNNYTIEHPTLINIYLGVKQRFYSIDNKLTSKDVIRWEDLYNLWLIRKERASNIIKLRYIKWI